MISYKISVAFIVILFISLFCAPIGKAQTIFEDNFNSYAEGTLPPGWITKTIPGYVLCRAPWKIHNGN